MSDVERDSLSLDQDAMQAATRDLPPDSPADAPPLPAPREVTTVAARRAWHEPRVHFWWIVALALTAAAAFLSAGQARAWSTEARLIRTGTRVDAIVWPDGAQVQGRPIGEEDPVRIVFPWNGQDFTLKDRRLAGRMDGMRTGTPMPIFVDPNDPRRYTARPAPQQLLKQLIGPLMLVAVAVLLIMLSVLKRRAVLSVWRGGEAHPAAVVETKQTALAPRSRLVRCALTGGADRRLIDVYVPHRAATLQPGDPLWLIMPPGRPERSIVAMLYG